MGMICIVQAIPSCKPSECRKEINLTAYGHSIVAPWLHSISVHIQNHWQVRRGPFLCHPCSVLRFAGFPISRKPARLFPVENSQNTIRPTGPDNDITAMEVTMGELDGTVVWQLIAIRLNPY